MMVLLICACRVKPLMTQSRQARHDAGMAETKDHAASVTSVYERICRHDVGIHISRYVEAVRRPVAKFLQRPRADSVLCSGRALPVSMLSSAFADKGGT